MGISQAAELCTKAAQLCQGKLMMYSSINERIDVAIFGFEDFWSRAEPQIEVLKRLEIGLSDRACMYYDCWLRRLASLLHAADVEISTFLDERVSVERKMRSDLLEVHIRKLNRHLRAWQAVFNPSWFLLTLLRSESVDVALQGQQGPAQYRQYIETAMALRSTMEDYRTGAESSGFSFGVEGFVPGALQRIPHSNAAMSRLANSTTVIIDTTAYPEAMDKERAIYHVSSVARILMCSQPETLGLLHCEGAVMQLDAAGQIAQFQYIFETLPDAPPKPTSLRSLLLDSNPSLDARFSVARSLAEAVMAVHCAGLLHTNFHPGTILCFGSLQNKGLKTYPVGFEHSRSAAAATTADTSLTTDTSWERNLYRHPIIQGSRPNVKYDMRHDIYSLGVCLLEVGIWRSFIQLSELGTSEPGPGLRIEEPFAMSDPLEAAWEVRDILLKLARTLLPGSMGVLYTEVVVSCLTCLDSGPSNMFAGEVDLCDEDGVLVGFVFAEKVLLQLESVSISRAGDYDCSVG